MSRFGQIQELQKFAAAHSIVVDQLNQETSLSNRHTFELNRAAALAKWRQLGAA